MTKVIVITPEELSQLIAEAVRNATQQSCMSADSDAKTNAASKYLTIDEAARYLNLAKQTVYTFTSRRAIPFIKRAKRLLFVKSELDEWLAQGKKSSIAQLRAALPGFTPKAA